jgi:tetratricopeptide (TPR) repeat protein
MVTDSNCEKRHGPNVVCCALILRVKHAIIKLWANNLCQIAWLFRDWFSALKRVSFVPMFKYAHTLPTRPGPAFWFSLLLACLLASCTTPSKNPNPQKEQSMAESAPADTVLEPTSEEVIYGVLAGEYLGSEGDLEGAVGQYLEAAMVSDDPEIARRATRIALATEAWQEAAMAADRWALLAPESVPARESAAGAMLLVGDYLGAEYQLLRILDILEDSTDAWVLVARILARSGGNPQQADSVMEELLKRRSGANSADVFYARSELAVQTGDLKRAFELARRAVELDPEQPDFLTWAGKVAINLDLQETGLEYIRRAWQLEPDNKDLGLAYADLLARNGKPDEARSVMQALPQTPDVYLSRILFEIGSKNRPAAEKLFTQLAETTFDDPQEKAYFQAQAAEALGLPLQAIAYLEQVTDGERGLTATLRRAELLGLEGDFPAARDELEALRESGDPLAIEQSWLTEARILRELDRKQESLNVLDQALAELPDSIAILYTHSLLAAELGKVELAEADLRKILAVQPDNAAALNALGYTLADQTDRLEEAEALIRQAYILQPNEASIVDSMGWIAFRLGRLDEAVQFLVKAWELDRNPEIAAHLGEVLWVSGKQDEALAVWREGFSIDAQNAVLRETLMRLGVDL